MKALITGANGFVGQALWKRLTQMQVETVGTARRALRADQFSAGGYCMVDLSVAGDALVEALEGCDVVFHVASKVDIWGPYQDFYQANVVGTQNLIKACRLTGVKYLVYTSSPSVVSDGSDLLGINEDYPYPKKHLANYPATKAIAEREVISAGKADLLTVSLRPHLIWGPGDRHLVPTIIERAKQRRLPQIGNGENLIDTTFIDDCVEAHICAWQALRSNPEISGKVYFISQGEPLKMWDWIRDILRRNNISANLPRVPRSLAYALAIACEAKAKLLNSANMPLLTRFAVDQLSTSHYFDISRAKKDLKFLPKYSMQQAMQVTFG